MKLRVIDFGTVPALRSQAVYHGIAETITPDSDPVLSLASPESPYVCVGMHQDIAQEVNEAYCREHGLPIYRRRVGGGAVYLDHNQLFTHFIYPRAKAPQFAKSLYPLFIEPVVRTYRELGVAAEYRPINDIHVNGRKIGGTGAASIGEATVMVGSFMFDFDIASMANCLKVPSEKFRDKLRSTLADYMTTLKKELDAPPSRDHLKEIFLAHCADVLQVEPVASTANDTEMAAISRAEKALGDPEWTYQKNRRQPGGGIKISAGTHLTQSAHKAPGGLIRVELLASDGKIADLAITGDFSCLPPHGIDMIAEKLIGVGLTHDQISRSVSNAIADSSIDMPGISAKDIATAVTAATQEKG